MPDHETGSLGPGSSYDRAGDRCSPPGRGVNRPHGWDSPAGSQEGGRAGPEPVNARREEGREAVASWPELPLAGGRSALLAGSLGALDGGWEVAVGKRSYRRGATLQARSIAFGAADGLGAGTRVTSQTLRMTRVRGWREGCRLGRPGSSARLTAGASGQGETAAGECQPQPHHGHRSSEETGAAMLLCTFRLRERGLHQGAANAQGKGTRGGSPGGRVGEGGGAAGGRSRQCRPGELSTAKQEAAGISEFWGKGKGGKRVESRCE